MARTRSTKAAPVDTKASEPKSTSSKFSLSSRVENPSKIFILPSKATPEARIVTLPNPRHGRPARYLVCPETGIYEFTKVAIPNTTPRSWLIETSSDSSTDSAGKTGVSMGQDLFLATSIDPLFLVLPALTEAQSKSSEGKRLFLSSDDYLDKLPQGSSHLSEIVRCDKTRKLIESRMAEVCDTVEAGDENMFRINESKLVNVVLEKAKRMREGGLAPSMEEKFVKKALEAPILVQKRETTEITTKTTTRTESQASNPESADSQSTAATTETEVSETSTAATSFTAETTTENIVSAIEASPEIINLQRLRIAFSFICSCYVASSLVAQLEDMLKREAMVDFSPLDEYLAKLSKLRAEAMAAHSIDYSRKRDLDEEEDEAFVKKRKMEEEKKKKSLESRGVRDLKKVNTKGMKKMSDFFKKK
ncbi:Ribonuclease H2 subunit B [Fusarium acutatum]|uniref:Ribonuclease H2 subunit B n=1 Tax=Fusarium acutatum TaxID=78861 RepID=A0A8H4K7Q0_9HYPO|nr:Ribonuclease H2 subunit B [Fusarium acutatum]